METGNVPHKVVEAVSRNPASSVKVYAVKSLHDVGVIRHLEIGNGRLSEPLPLDVFRVVLAYRNAGVNDVGDSHHNFIDFLLELRLGDLKLLEPLSLIVYLLLDLFGLLAVSLCHKTAYLLGKAIALGSELIRLGYRGAILLVQLDDLVHEGKL